MTLNQSNKTVFQAIRKKHLSDIAGKFFFNMLGSLFPLLVGVLIAHLANNSLSLSSFFMRGEFALYSAALIISSYYLVLSDHDSASFPFRKWFGLVILFIIVTAAVAYTLLLMTDTTPKKIVFVDSKLLLLSSFVLYLISIFHAFAAEVIDLALKDLNINKIRDDRRSNLNEQYDKLDG